MKQARVLAFCGLAFLLALAPARAGWGLKLGEDTGKLGAILDIPLTLTTTDEIQGLVAVFHFDATKLQAMDLVESTVTLAGADVVTKRVDAALGAALLGVVMDNDGADNEKILPGNDIPLAVLSVKALAPTDETPVDVPIEFADQAYAMVEGGPLLDNIVVVGGLSFGLIDGLELDNGVAHLIPIPPATFKIGPSTPAAPMFGDNVTVPVLLDNQKDVQGYQVSVMFETGLTLTDIVLGADASDADFTAANIYADGGTIGVVMDLYEPWSNAVVDAGSDNEIAVLKFATPAHACVAESEVAAQTETFSIDFVDNHYGDPLLENLVVIGGLSVNPDKVGGSVTLKPCAIVTVKMTFAVGSCDLVPDPDRSDPTQPNYDKDATVPGTIVGHPCEDVQVGFYYLSPEDDDQGDDVDSDHIQAISIAACFDPRFLVCQETYSLDGTVTQMVGAEFVNVQCESTTADGDPGEIVIGILVDALPPFDGQTLPPTSYYLKLICVDFQIPCDAPCECSEIYFCDGANGRGTVPIKNLASVNNQSVKPQKIPGKVCVNTEPTFVRGDCNFHYSDGEQAECGPDVVDISDAQAVLSYLFQTGTWYFDPPCLDACDANDDGRVDMADAVYILRYLFKFAEPPKSPWPCPDVDLTLDRLDCEDGQRCRSDV